MEMARSLVISFPFWTVLLISVSTNGVQGEPSFFAMFVFGDSLVDNGNNNHLNSLAKANFAPYGIDFSEGPTGRFSNGKTLTDILGEIIGLPLLPAFADTIIQGENISWGVNYASAAAGILDGKIWLCMVWDSKFLLAGLGPLGCIPSQLSIGFAPPGECRPGVNDIVHMFNVLLRSLVDQLNAEYHGSIFVYGNTSGAFSELMNNAKTYGFTVTDSGCCGVGRNQGQITCLPGFYPCQDRDQYLFWDAFHTSEAVNKILAHRTFTGPPSDCNPVNVKQMAQMWVLPRSKQNFSAVRCIKKLEFCLNFSLL
ncbi:GDSL esterase/lipase [Spatholobus suberectus]|nr:GDSL esterase/lipase [Spatholobus suberectus]